MGNIFSTTNIQLTHSAQKQNGTHLVAQKHAPARHTDNPTKNMSLKQPKKEAFFKAAKKVAMGTVETEASRIAAGVCNK